ncbi:predicted protein [Uncinocarpus reesii 1704]|uniref:Spore wall maturation protein DIT1 n=1 Tax=Uncinocarpus reesii (strain UAMH 1704) TaxID=336963 RepID=C4JUV9_UNCRE|nr:uncharacterized protein UREG_04912 [Uncinocarpus reesii 1704]EEP80070.1 predicted protein [Uncinocarpus reesii 1704]
MEFSNDGDSIYHRNIAIYVRRTNGELIRCLGKNHQWVNTSWPTIRSTVLMAKSNHVRYFEKHGLSRFRLSNTALETETIDIYETKSHKENEVTGLILRATEPERMSASRFEEFFSMIILTQTQIDITMPIAELPSEGDSTVQSIVDLFDELLRYKVPNDLWNDQGREYFASKVRFFTSRNLRLEMCLPAFPCKSSNPEKVAGRLPDKGEEIALRRLHGFVRQIENIYTPGARVWIISDGHVFSDCSESISYFRAIESSAGEQKERVCFRSLIDIFNLKTTDEIEEYPDMPNLEHHIATELKNDAETCRRILMAGCEPSQTGLRARIESQESSILALYRGFSRFMLEDLDLHPLTQSLSRSQRKKLATKVSFEMILRNQAYSNLVELMFPDHIRLSIHAHNNSGPKFGIRLFDTATARATHSLSAADGELLSHDLLHIPTPWHNCVASCAGESMIHIVKSGVIREALSTPDYTGSWVEGNLLEGQGGYFSLQKRAVSRGLTMKDGADHAAVSRDTIHAVHVKDKVESQTVLSVVSRIPWTLYDLSIGWLMSVVSVRWRAWMKRRRGAA